MQDSSSMPWVILSEGLECAPGGAWSQLVQRIRAKDFSRAFPAARVSNTLTTYNFGDYTKSGQDYDRSLIQENANFVTEGRLDRCSKVGCKAVKQQLQGCLFSWWTDLPWLNLSIASRMLESLSHRKAAAVGGFRNLTRFISFPRFEYMAYQQWCVLHEGFSFKNVTNITGEAKWGSYLEDPLPGARLAELTPLWLL